MQTSANGVLLVKISSQASKSAPHSHNTCRLLSRCSYVRRQPATKDGS